jgi:hypothetical protein
MKVKSIATVVVVVVVERVSITVDPFKDNESTESTSTDEHNLPIKKKKIDSKSSIYSNLFKNPIGAILDYLKNQ